MLGLMSVHKVGIIRTSELRDEQVQQEEYCNYEEQIDRDTEADMLGVQDLGIERHKMNPQSA
eukprot:85849-Amphidinium_carterae.1